MTTANESVAEYDRVFLRSRSAPFKLTDPPFSSERIYDTDVEYVRARIPSATEGEVARRIAEKINDYNVQSVYHANLGRLKSAQQEIEEVAAIAAAELASLAPAAAAPRDAMKIAHQAVSYLFENGNGEFADRLVLTQDAAGQGYGKQRDIGGWCRQSVIDVIVAAFGETVAPLPAPPQKEGEK